MNYGLYLSAAGTISSLHRQDVLANNLANVNTTGYKPDNVYVRARDPERVESHSLASLNSPSHLLEQLGGGTFAEPTYVHLRQGVITRTSNDLDIAIEGDGFLVVSNGREGDHLRLTRDGRLTRNASGELALASNGCRVLDVNDQPIRISGAGTVRIDAEGRIIQNGQSIAQLQIASVKDARELTKDGSNLLKVNARWQTQAGTAVVRQGYIEGSGVDPILALNQMINASKAVQANATMMQYHDHILGQAVNTFGRVA